VIHDVLNLVIFFLLSSAFLKTGRMFPGGQRFFPPRWAYRSKAGPAAAAKGTGKEMSRVGFISVRTYFFFFLSLAALRSVSKTSA
jgi:hypothetical protein